MLNKIGILLFDDVELLDFAGPLQVFSSLKYVLDEKQVHVYTIGLTKEIKVSKIDMKVVTEFTIEEFDEQLDLLIIPGGFGTRPLVKNDELLAQIEKLTTLSSRVGSVCTGSLVLAKLNMLNHKKATTHYAALDLLTKLDPSIEVDRSRRYHDHDSVIVSEGVSAGIDMSFYLLEKFHGKKVSDTVRKYIEYYPEPYNAHPNSQE